METSITANLFLRPLFSGQIRQYLALATIGITLTSLSFFATSPRAAADCPNENLRGVLLSNSLPDCRAYEMVSPSYKEGYNLFSVSYAPDGEQAILYSLGTLSGTQGSGEAVPETNFYLVKRTNSGWQLAPINAPLTSYVGQVVLSYEAQSGLTLWDQHTPQEAAITRGLYIRSADGTYHFVGRLNPVAGGNEESSVIEATPRNYDRPVGATAQFTHILLFAPSPQDYWTTFDETSGAGGSLYEYSGTDNLQPILVGVTGSLKGSTQLVGKCGEGLGDGRGNSAYNALSSDGETVFFTVEPKGLAGCSAAEAPTYAEVYARLHGSLLSPLSAATVDIGESECTANCGGESGKNFEGASEDGTRVYFTSTQKLTEDAVDATADGDANSSAGCAALTSGPGCSLYLYDFDAPEHTRLTRVAGEVLGVAAVAEDGSRVYFVSRAELPEAGANPYGKEAQAGSHNLYVYDEQSKKISFIATLGGEQEIWQKENFRPVQEAENGRYLLFASSASEVTGADDTGSVTQLFEYAAAVGAEPAELVRVTKGEGGYNNNGNAATRGVSPENIALSTQSHGRGRDFKEVANSLDISRDGRSVIFSTAGRLSPLASSALLNCTSVYEFRTLGFLSEGTVHLLSDGRDVQPNKGSACGAEFQGMDANGENVLISTADSLSAADTDGVQRDLYDVRVDGGLPPRPEAGEQAGCGPVACEGASSAGVFAPILPSSLTEKAEGNDSSIAGQTPRNIKEKQRQDRSTKGRLSVALRACRRKQGKRRKSCERAARKRYRVTSARRSNDGRA